MPKVSPKVLRWARETAGIAPDDAARLIGLSGKNGIARLEALESGEDEPSRALLGRMSDRYRRPLLTFYLPAPPDEATHGRDFRTLPDAPATSSEALLSALLRHVQASQGIVKAALEEAEEDVELSFVGSAKLRDGEAHLAESIRETIGVGIAEFRAQPNVSEAFSILRRGAERAGVYVLLVGNLGSYHSNIEASVFRGIALADPVAPFVVINENDSRAAWSFTLLHELAHIWLGETGVSGYRFATTVEAFCNTTASRYLLNPNELRGLSVEGTSGEIKARIDAFAAERNLSRKMVAYNLLREERITSKRYEQISALLDRERAEAKEERKGGRGEGGPNYYVVRRHRLGNALLDTVGRFVASGTLSTTKAAIALGVKPTSVASLVGRTQPPPEG